MRKLSKKQAGSKKKRRRVEETEESVGEQLRQELDRAQKLRADLAEALAASAATRAKLRALQRQDAPQDDGEPSSRSARGSRSAKRTLKYIIDGRAGEIPVEASGIFFLDDIVERVEKLPYQDDASTKKARLETRFRLSCSLGPSTSGSRPAPLSTPPIICRA